MCINGGVLLSTTSSPLSSEAMLSMSRFCEVLQKDKVDVGEESSLALPSLLVFVERPLPFRLLPPEELCSKAMIHQLDDSYPGSRLDLGLGSVQ